MVLRRLPLQITRRAVIISILLFGLVAVSDAWVYWIPILKQKTTIRRVPHIHHHNHLHKTIHHGWKCGWMCGGSSSGGGNRGGGGDSGWGWGWKGSQMDSTMTKEKWTTPTTNFLPNPQWIN